MKTKGVRVIGVYTTPVATTDDWIELLAYIKKVLLFQGDRCAVETLISITGRGVKVRE